MINTVLIFVTLTLACHAYHGDDTALDPHLNTPFEKALKIVEPFTMVAHNKLKRAWSVIHRDLVNVEGDFVECGVWKGGSTAINVFAEMHANRGIKKRDFWLFDTFEGLPMPDPKMNPDGYTKWVRLGRENGTKDSVVDGQGYRDEDGNLRWNYSPMDTVKKTLSLTGYDMEKFHFIKGKVEDTLKISSNIPQKIAFLRLDTDWYESTVLEMKYLTKNLVIGGVIHQDDYHNWSGARTATDEFLKLYGDNFIISLSSSMWWATKIKEFDIAM